MTLVRWKPVKNLVSFPYEIDRFFSDFGLDYDRSDTVWSPNVDVSENEKNYEVKAEIPGLKKEDIKVMVEDNVLKLSGEKKLEKETKEKNYHRMERSYGKFERSFRLPKEVKKEEIRASYKNGVLDVVIPKAEEVKPKQIAVS